MHRHRRRQDRAPASAARSRSTSPGLAELVAKHRDRLHFSTDIADALEHARLLFVAVGTPPTYSGDADLSAVHAVVDAMPASDRHALVMKSTVPVGTGASIKRVFAEQRQGGLPLRLLPRVPQGGLGDRGLPAPRPRRRRRRRRLGRRRRRRALPAAADPSTAAGRRARAHGHRQRRDGQARRQRLPGHEDLVHQRDRQRLRGHRRRRHRGRPRASASTTASARSSCSRASASAARCFPKDVSALKQLAGNSGYHFQLLNAVIEVNELQKRRVIGKLQKHLGVARGQAHRAARPGLQAEHRRHARGVVARPRRPAAGRRREGRGLRPDRRGGGAQAHARASTSPMARSTRPRRRRGRARDRVGRVQRRSTGDEVADAMAGTVVIDGRNALDPRRVRAAGLAYEGIGRSLAAACRPSSSSAARARGCAR